MISALGTIADRVKLYIPKNSMDFYSKAKTTLPINCGVWVKIVLLYFVKHEKKVWK